MDRLVGSLSKFSQNAIQVYDEEMKNYQRRRECGALPKYVRDAIQGKRSRRHLPSHRSATATAASTSPTRSRSLSSIPRTTSAMAADDPDTEVVTYSSDAEIDWKHSFHHLHYESKQKERIRRLEFLRMTAEAQERDASALQQERKEAQQQAAFQQRMESITLARAKLEQHLSGLDEQEEMVRVMGLQRVHDRKRPSLLRQCGDTVPLKGEAVRLLPVNLVEDVFRSYRMVCPHELWQFNQSIGHVVEIRPFPAVSSTRTGHSHHHTSNNNSSSNPAGPSQSTNVPSRAATSHAVPKSRNHAASGHGKDIPDDYAIVVRFEPIITVSDSGELTANASNSKVFELLASCVELVEDPSAVSAPLLLSAEGQVLELTSIDVHVDVVGDSAAVTHKSSWIASRDMQKNGSGFVDVALLCPIVENAQLIGLAVDVGDAKLRTVVLDDADGQELMKSCSRARTFRLQQHQQHLGSPAAGSTSSAPLGIPIFVSEEGDPAAFISDEASNSIVPTGVRTLGVWQDAFRVDERTASLGATSQESSVDGVLTDSADSMRRLSGDVGDEKRLLATQELAHTRQRVKGTLIPLRQHKVSETIHVLLKFHVDGAQVQKTAFASAERGSAVFTESATEFCFPSRYPEACLSPRFHRGFNDISSFTVSVLSGNTRKAKVYSNPRTELDPNAALSASFLRHSQAVSIYHKADDWKNTSIRLQVSYQAATAPSRGVAEVEVVAHHEANAAAQFDFLVVQACGPEVDPGEIPVRRQVCIAIDDHGSPITHRNMDAIHRGVMELVDSLSSEDMITFSILTESGWSFLAPHDDAQDVSNPVTSRKAGMHPTPRVADSGAHVPGASHASGALRTHRAASMWWRKHHIDVAGHVFRDKWLAYVTKGANRTAHHPCVADATTTMALWIKYHHHLASLTPSENGREDIRECFLFTGRELCTEAQQLVALQLHSGGSAIRFHICALFPGVQSTTVPRNTLRRRTSATALLWQAVAQRTKGSFTVLHEGAHHILRRLLALMTAASHYQSIDVDVYVPSTNDVTPLTPLWNIPSGGSLAAVFVASYGGLVASFGSNAGSSAPHSPVAESTVSPATAAAPSANGPSSPVESISFTLKLSTIRKVVKRVGLGKLPPNSLTPLLARRAMVAEMATVWFSKLLQAALDARQHSFLSGSSSHAHALPPIAPLGMSASVAAMDVLETSFRIQMPQDAPPAQLLYSSASDNSNNKSPPPPQQQQHQRSTRMFFYTKLAAAAMGGTGASAGRDSAVKDRVSQMLSYPPVYLGAPPSAQEQSLPTTVRTWRDHAYQRCSNELLEMGLFLRCDTCVFDLLDRHVDGTWTGADDMLDWITRQRDETERRTIALIGEESAVRGEVEFEEWSQFLENAKAFHRASNVVKSRHLERLKDMFLLEEVERAARVHIDVDQVDTWEALLDATTDDYQILTRHNKHQREARQNIEYEEEEMRQILELRLEEIDRSLHILMLRKDRGASTTAGGAFANPTTTAEVGRVLETLDTFRTEVEVVAMFCAALTVWSVEPEHAQLLGQVGGVLRMKAMLQTYRSRTAVVELVLYVLHHLALVHTNQGKIEHSGIATRMLNAADLHPNHADIQFAAVKCCASTAKLTQNLRQLYLSSPNGAAAIVERFPRFMHRQQYAVDALSFFYSLSAEVGSHRLLAETALPQLVVAAMVLHPRCHKVEGTLLRIIRNISSSRQIRMVVAVRAVATRFVVSVLSRLSNSLVQDEDTESRSLASTAVAELRELALETLAKMCGNVADYPTSHLVASTTQVLVTLEKRLASAERVELRSLTLVRSILSRFSLADVAWMEESSLYDETLRPLYKPWQHIHLDPEEDGSYQQYPHPLACCYGKARRATAIIGNQPISCVVRLFTNFELRTRVVVSGSDEAEVQARLTALGRCALALQVQDALENTLICPSTQLRCLGFSSYQDIHATIYEEPPRYTLRTMLMAVHEQQATAGGGMLLAAWIHLATLLMDHVLYFRAQGTIHGNLDLDHVFVDDDVSREATPRFVIGPALAIPADVARLVPPEEHQTMFTQEEFADAASRTTWDDESDARRLLMEALQYGNAAEEATDVEAVLAKIPPRLAAIVFGLRRADRNSPGDTNTPFEHDAETVRSELVAYMRDSLGDPVIRQRKAISIG